jgi:peptidoglycan/xylan/chitin deacetylase (PgdA/CDA1 family)
LSALEKISNSKWVKQLFPSCIWSLKDNGDKVIYLTFDDGPISDVTPWVLKTLDDYKAKATFFCIGSNVIKNKNIYTDIITSGHAVGNHTQHHLNGWKTLFREYISDVNACDELVHSNLFRPPYGKLKPMQLHTLVKKYNVIMWSFLTGDYLATLNCDEVFENMREKIKTGDIIVFHDSLKAEKNLKYLLPKVLHYFSHQGYVFKAIHLN